MSVHTVVSVLETQALIPERKSLFDELDKRAREIEASWKSTWSEMADLCTTMRDNELWRDGGYASFGAWLKAACPTSRSYAYLAMGCRDELTDLSTEELRQIPLGNADILRRTPKQHRNGKILDAAKCEPPREFIGTVIQAVPNGHLEQKMVHRFRLDISASKMLQGGLDMWRILNDDPCAHGEDALEGIVADYMLQHQDEYEQKLAKT